MSESIDMAVDRIRRLARRIEQTNDSGEILQLSIVLHWAAVDLKNQVRHRQTRAAPDDRAPREG